MFFLTFKASSISLMGKFNVQKHYKYQSSEVCPSTDLLEWLQITVVTGYKIGIVHNTKMECHRSGRKVHFEFTDHVWTPAAVLQACIFIHQSIFLSSFSSCHSYFYL